MTTIFTAIFLGPLLLCLALTRTMIWAAPRLGIVDRPAARKFHANVTPLGGGVAIHLTVTICLLTVLFASWLTRFDAVRGWFPDEILVHVPGILASSRLLFLILTAATIQMILGLVDDWRPGGLSYQLRLGIEVLLVIGLISQGVNLSLFTDNVWLTAPVTVLWVVGLTNAINFLDNMDALSGGVSLIAAGFFAAIALLVGSLFIAGCFLVLSGALLGFLRYNWGPAKIFMGDAGSNFLGFYIGVLTVVGTFHVEIVPHVTVFAPLCILAVPIYDSVAVISIRLAQGRSPFQPDKQHLSHRLVDLGLRPQNAVLFIYLLSITTGLGGVMLYYIQARAAVLVLLQVLATLGIVALLEYAAHRHGKRLSGMVEAQREPAGAGDDGDESDSLAATSGAGSKVGSEGLGVAPE